MKQIQLHNADCFDILPTLPDDSVDMVLCDPPYGMTDCKWDTKPLDFAAMWKELNRIAKPRAAIVFTACQPFTSQLVCSNLKQFKHEWIWEKNCPGNFAAARFGPMRAHESVLVFSPTTGGIEYYPIKEERLDKKGRGIPGAFTRSEKARISEVRAFKSHKHEPALEKLRYPFSVRRFDIQRGHIRGLHPTQKPEALMEYFIRTYTQPGQTVLDFAMGSGTTGVAAVHTDRAFIGIEIAARYFEIAEARIRAAQPPLFAP